MQGTGRIGNMLCATKHAGLAGLAMLAGLLLSGPAPASGLLPNGDFEAGFLIGWLATERRDGISDIVTAGRCFSDDDTTRLTLFGNHAAILKSGPSGRRGSVGILTSESFIAGDGVMFAALTGTRDGFRIDRPVDFEVRILTPDGRPLTGQSFSTSVVRLQAGCPSQPRDGRFFVHYFDTRKFADQEIRIQFRQNTNTRGLQPFTLIDRVVRFDKGEAPLFSSKPEAVAAISRTRRGVLRLDASRSLDPDGGPRPLHYSWQLDGETRIRLGEYHCLADLEEGTYRATLYVNDGFHAVSDELVFEVSDDPTVVFPAANENTSPDFNIQEGATIEIPGCETETVDTSISVDAGVPGSDDDDGDPGGGDDQGDGDGNGDGNGNGDGDGNGGGDGNGDGPNLDLDADDSSVAGSNFQTTYTVGGFPVSIADFDLLITDADDDTIESATIRLVNGFDDDQLTVDGPGVPAGIDFQVTADSVVFTGAASAFDYGVAIIGTVLFENTNAIDPALGIRIVEIRVNDGVSDSNVAFAFITVE